MGFGFWVLESRFSGVIYGVEELVQRQVSDGAIPAGTGERAPRLMSQRNDGHAGGSCLGCHLPLGGR
jgi:hypothetical protein